MPNRISEKIPEMAGAMGDGNWYDRVIAITGASSGIGAGLARHYARESGAGGKKRTLLALASRGRARLVEVARKCQSSTCDVEAVTLDISDRHAVASWLHLLRERARRLDIVFANAGVDGREVVGRAVGGEPVFAEDVLQFVFSVNVMGTINTAGPALEIMSSQGFGQLGIVSSGTALLKYGNEISGKRLPEAVPYVASKEAQSALAKGLHFAYKDSGVDVRTIYPGYVESEITKRNKHHMHQLMGADEAAAEIARQMRGSPAAGGGISFPLSNRVGTCFLNCCFSMLGGAWCIDRCIPQQSMDRELVNAQTGSDGGDGDADTDVSAGAGEEKKKHEWFPRPQPMQPPVVYDMEKGEVAEDVTGRMVNVRT